MHPIPVYLCEMFMTTDFPISPILPLTGPGISDDFLTNNLLAIVDESENGRSLRPCKIDEFRNVHF